MAKRKVSIRQTLKTMEYQKEHIKQMKLDLNRKYDADVIKYLDAIENKRQYIIGLIRKDMENIKAFYVITEYDEESGYEDVAGTNGTYKFNTKEEAEQKMHEWKINGTIWKYFVDEDDDIIGSMPAADE